MSRRVKARGAGDPKRISRSVSFRIDFSEQEKAQLAALADDRGVSQAGWMRMAIREGFATLERERKSEGRR